MKKNAMLKIAAILMVAVLLTTCAISSTFAKYVTKEVGANYSKAVAAKWGLGITITGNENALFETQYSNDGKVVIDGAGTYVVAPAKNTYTDANKLSVAFSGVPQVAYRVTVTPAVELNNWTVNSTDYCPVTFNFGGDTISQNKGETNAAYAKRVNAALAEAILGDGAQQIGETGVYYKEYAPNVAAGTATGTSEVALTWGWAFEVDENANDDNDTALGNAAADTDPDNDPTVVIDFAVKAEQIDKFAA